jgi:hypothetical protein
MTSVRLWKEAKDLRPWAAVGQEACEHLLAQLLHGNLLSDEACAVVIDAATKAVASVNFEDDLGFFNSVAVYFKEGMVTLDHAVPDYGTYVLPADQLLRVLSEWRRVLLSEDPTECQLQIDE